ncbi:MAG: XRE family transcriptional regulator [Eubacteriales bacterium]|nr:XRE family transcriptional regulator [Eubacteriales bacterium]
MNAQLVAIAQRIRELREILEMSPQHVAEKVGIPLEQYQSYEDATADIPISVLYAVAGVLGVDATVLMTGEAPRMSAYTLVRKGQGVSVERYKEYKFSALAFNYIDRDMEPMIVDLDVKDTAPELVVHRGQEFNYVLKGTVRVRIGAHQFDLAVGDSIYFDPRIPHGQMAVGGPAQFLTVINE